MSSGTENSSMANLTAECQEEGKGRCLGLGQAAYRSWHFAHLSRTARNTEEADIPSHFIMPAAWKHPSGRVPEILRKFLGYARELWGRSGSHSRTQVLFVFVAILHS